MKNTHYGKQTHWWNEEIRGEINTKISKYVKTYLGLKITKEMIIKSKEITWEVFRDKIKESWRRIWNYSNEVFIYKHVKIEKQTTTKDLKDKKLKEHFEDLLDENWSIMRIGRNREIRTRKSGNKHQKTIT